VSLMHPLPSLGALGYADKQRRRRPPHARQNIFSACALPHDRFALQIHGILCILSSCSAKRQGTRNEDVSNVHPFSSRGALGYAEEQGRGVPTHRSPKVKINVAYAFPDDRFVRQIHGIL
jgi:hypothetical protein